eukprot:gene26060-32589_t
MNLMKLVKDKGFVQEVEGALQDIRQWWPKLKVGGIMAGHDYMLKSEVDEANKNWKGPKDDWSINFDGTINERTVRGAVDDFFSDRFGDMKGCPRQATISYRETAFNTWASIGGYSLNWAHINGSGPKVRPIHLNLEVRRGEGFDSIGTPVRTIEPTRLSFLPNNNVHQ